jgi:hypothetical protein
MRRFGVATLVASGLATAFLGFAVPAQAAPTGPGNAQTTIDQLDDRGYEIRVNHHGAVKPLDESEIVSVRWDNRDRVVYVDVR